MLRCDPLYLYFVFFIKIFGCDFSDHSGQNNHGYQVGEGHEGVCHISYVPDDVQMWSLDIRTNEQQDDEREPVRINDSHSKDILQTFFTVIAPSQ